MQKWLIFFLIWLWLWKAKPDSLPQFQVSIHLQVVFLYTLQSSEMMDLPCISWFCRGWSLQSNRITLQPTFSLFQNPVAYRSDIFTIFLHLSATYPQDLFKDPEILCFPSFLTSFGFLTSYVMLLYCLPVSFISVKFLEGTVVNLFLQVNLHLRCRMVTWFYLCFDHLFWAVSASKFAP